MKDISLGAYTLPEHTQFTLRNILSLSATKNYFYETIPSMANPLVWAYEVYRLQHGYRICLSVIS